jgi:hypothetical protein
MEKEHKDLLITDLSGRLPHGVKVHAKYVELGETIELDAIVKMIDADGFVGIEVNIDFSSAWTCVDIDNVKPYLFPISSMTEEQRKELFYLSGIDIVYGKFYTNNEFTLEETLSGINWLLKNHFDINELIPKGLAKDATGLNIY